MKPIVLRALIDDFSSKVEAIGRIESNASRMIADFKEKHGYQESTVGPGAVIRRPALKDENGTLYLEGKIRTKHVRLNLEIEDNLPVAEALLNELGLNVNIDDFAQFEQIIEKELESTISLYKQGEKAAMQERIPNWGKYGV